MVMAMGRLRIMLRSDLRSCNDITLVINNIPLGKLGPFQQSISRNEGSATLSPNDIHSHDYLSIVHLMNEKAHKPREAPCYSDSIAPNQELDWSLVISSHYMVGGVITSNLVLGVRGL